MINKTFDELKELKNKKDKMSYHELRAIAKEFDIEKTMIKKDELLSKLDEKIDVALDITQQNKINKERKRRAKGKNKINWHNKNQFDENDKVKVKFVANTKFKYNGYKVNEEVGTVTELPKPIADYAVKKLSLAVYVKE